MAWVLSLKDLPGPYMTIKMWCRNKPLLNCFLCQLIEANGLHHLVKFFDRVHVVNTSVGFLAALTIEDTHPLKDSTQATCGHVENAASMRQDCIELFLVSGSGGEWYLQNWLLHSGRARFLRT